jgi:DNA-binding CsgD family transcriptional regulator
LDFYNGKTWRSTAMYAEVFRPEGIEWDLVMPLPSPRGVSRRVVFFRAPGPPFGDGDKAAALVMRPHIADALRTHNRRSAAAALTPRQRELLALCAQGLDNTRIARRLDMSIGTVRKHLENAFARLGVNSRGEATALLYPDMTWR